jgi:glucokinase
MTKSLYFGVDVGGTFTKTALVDAWGRLILKSKIASHGFSNKSFFAKSLKDNLLSLLGQARSGATNVKGVGIGLPGPVDFDKGVVLSLTNIKGWSRFPLAAYLKKTFSCPVLIENDANCMALAEARCGAARGLSCALCLTLGTGVGGGLIIDKNIYRSPYFLGGEVGHIPLSLKGPVCACGGRGCLERYVGNRALLAQAKGLFKKSLSLEEVSRLVSRKDPRALSFWRKAGSRIGLALSGIVNVFNPQVIVIGGGVAQAGDVLLKAITETVREHAMEQFKDKVNVKKAALGNDAGVLGAAFLIKEHVEK